MKKGSSPAPPLEPPATFYVSAACGWMDLGLSEEGLAELDQLGNVLQAHPAVLNVRWALNQKLQRWDECLGVAERMLQLHPGLVDSWVHCAYATRRATGGSLKKARAILLRAARRFPNEIMIAFNLACYESQLDRTKAARHWLERAINLCPEKKARLHWLRNALADTDLEPMREEVKLWLEREGDEI